MYQVGALMSFAKSFGLEIEHVRPHGAMYKMASEDYTFASSVAKAIQKCSLRFKLFREHGIDISWSY